MIGMLSVKLWKTFKVITVIIRNDDMIGNIKFGGTDNDMLRVMAGVMEERENVLGGYIFKNFSGQDFYESKIILNFGHTNE